MRRKETWKSREGDRLFRDTILSILNSPFLWVPPKAFNLPENITTISGLKQSSPRRVRRILNEMEKENRISLRNKEILIDKLTYEE